GLRTPENIQMICLVRLLVAAVCGLLIGVERQTRMKGAGSRTHMMVSLGAALMTLVSSYGFLLIVGAAGVSVDVSRVAASIAVGLTDGKGDLVRLYDWLEQKKITVREIALKRQEGSSVKIVLFIAMPRHFDKADFLRLQVDIPGVQSVEI
ncbi:MAG: MgtC/SapB family protein, partial [Agathobaculum butyriciproducens]